MRIYLFFIFSFSLFSQELGTLSGTIKDAKTGMESPGVNVMVKGTYYGAATDLNGNFNIRNISPGSYDIEVSMIGYKVILNTSYLILLMLRYQKEEK